MSSGMQDNNPFAPPAAHVADVETGERNAQGLVLATRWSRFWAALLDVVVLLLAFAVLAWLTPLNIFRKTDVQWMGFELREALTNFAIFMAPNVYLLARQGQTLGKSIVGIRIVRSDGSRASLGRLVGLRYAPGSLLAVVPALSQVFGIVDALFIFRESRRCLHDLIADTIVVKA